MAFFRLLLVLAGFLLLRRILRKKSAPSPDPLGGGKPRAKHLDDEVSPSAQSPQPIEDAEYEELR